MSTKSRHMASLTRVPAPATSVGEIKYDALGVFLLQLESIRLSAPWGIVFPDAFQGKGGVDPGDDTGGDTGGGTGGGGTVIDL